jgi:hypothetical protein
MEDAKTSHHHQQQNHRRQHGRDASRKQAGCKEPCHWPRLLDVGRTAGNHDGDADMDGTPENINAKQLT